MISAKLRATAGAIRPLMDRNLADALDAQVRKQPRRAFSLGQLDRLFIHFGLIRGSSTPALHRKGLIAFAGDHGVLDELDGGGPEQTLREVRQFLRGGSAAQVLCRQSGIEPLLVNVGLAGEEEPGALNFPIAPGTMNMTRGAAMTEEQVNAALEIGLHLAGETAVRFDVVGLAQIGAGGDLAAAALISALSGRDAAETTLHPEGVSHFDYARSLHCVRSAVIRHQSESVSHFGSLRALGGLEIAAMAGFLLGAASRRLPVVIDGLAAGAAAAVARAMAPDALDAMIFSHRLPDAAHASLLKFLAVEPLLDLQISEAAGFGSVLGIQALELAVLLNLEIRDLTGTP